MSKSLGVLVCGAALVGLHCAREDDEPRRLDLNPASVRAAAAALEAGVTPAPPARASEATRQGSSSEATRQGSSSEAWRGDVDAALPRFQEITTHTVVVDAGAKPLLVNPDDAILERARVAAGGCFASLSAGAGSPPERTAHIVFTIIPTGTVTNADVSSADTSAEAVITCLRQQALTTRFSDNAGGPLRSYAIDVRVIAKGNTGAR